MGAIEDLFDGGSGSAYRRFNVGKCRFGDQATGHASLIGDHYRRKASFAELHHSLWGLRKELELLDGLNVLMWRWTTIQDAVAIQKRRGSSAHGRIESPSSRRALKYSVK